MSKKLLKNEYFPFSFIKFFFLYDFFQAYYFLPNIKRKGTIRIFVCFEHLLFTFLVVIRYTWQKRNLSQRNINAT